MCGLCRHFANDIDIVQMYIVICNNYCAEMRLKFQNSPNSSILVTTPEVGGVGFNRTGAKPYCIDSDVPNFK